MAYLTGLISQTVLLKGSGGSNPSLATIVAVMKATRGVDIKFEHKIGVCDIAQLVRALVEPKVGGSSPPIVTI